MAFCSKCGAELSEGARFCASCGAATGSSVPPTTDPVQPAPPYASPAQPIAAPSRGGLGWILPLMVVVALGVIGYLLLVPGTKKTASEETPAGETAPVAETATANTAGTARDVSAATLDSAFNIDPIGAAARYPGRVRVSGIIATMVQPGSTPSLSMEGRTRFNYMIVNFPDGYRTRLIPLAKGQSISVVCDEVRSLGGTTILSGCLLD